MPFLPRFFTRSRNHPYARGMRHFNRLEFSEAAAEFDRYLASEAGGTSPDLQLARFYSAEAHAKLGMSLYRSGDLARARGELERAAGVQGSYPDLYAYLGILDAREGKLESALGFLSHALALAPHQPEALAARVVVLEQLGRGSDASHDLTHLLAVGLPLPEAPPVAVRVPSGTLRPTGLRWRTLAVDSGNRAALLETLAVVEETLAAHPRYPDLHARRGDLLGLIDRRVEAIRAYEAALALNPGYLEAQLGHGIALLFLGRAEEARASLVRAAALKPHFADVAYYEGVAHSWTGRGDEATLAFSRALSVNPAFWRARLALAELVLAEGDRRRAVVELGMALVQHVPQGTRWGKEAAWAGTGDGSPHPAWVLRGAVRSHPGYADLRCRLASACFESGDVDTARGELTEAVQLNPAYADALLGLGRVEIAAGRADEALAHLSRAARLVPERADVHYLFGEALRLAGDPAGAAAAYREALIRNPVYVDALSALADLERRRRSQAARGLWEMVLALEPEHPAAREALAAGRGEDAGGSGAGEAHAAQTGFPAL